MGCGKIKIRLYAGSSLELHKPNYYGNIICGEVNDLRYGKIYVNWIIRREGSGQENPQRLHAEHTYV